MKTLVVYDSVSGNTEKVARAIGSAVGSDCKVIHASEAGSADLKDIDLLIAGAPTQGGRPTEAMQKFLADTPSAVCKGMKIATFDTRLPNTIVKIFGFAAGKIGDSLKSKQCTMVVPPEGFFVAGKPVSLKTGELERAAVWAKGVIAACAK